jgi:hypothetical protein
VNQQQRRILQACLAVICLMSMFPPFVAYLPNGVQSNEGYSFVFSPPIVGYSLKSSVDLLRLLMQWIAVGAIGGVTYFLAGQAPQNPYPENEDLILGLSRQKREKLVKLSGPILRFIRGFLILLVMFIGVVGASGLLNILTLDPQDADQTDWGKLVAFFIIKLVVVIVILVINKGLLHLINKIYRTHYGHTFDVVVRWRDL